jgi:hypothetical protein
MTDRLRIPSSPALAWFGVLTPPLAWAIQLVLGYAFEEAGCGRPGSTLWGTGIEPLTAVVIIACAGLAVLGGLAALVSWRATADGDAADTRGVNRFMASTGMLGSVIFLVAICLSGIALIPLDACNAG